MTMTTAWLVVWRGVWMTSILMLSSAIWSPTPTGLTIAEIHFHSMPIIWSDGCRRLNSELPSIWYDMCWNEWATSYRRRCPATFVSAKQNGRRALVGVQIGHDGSGICGISMLVGSIYENADVVITQPTKYRYLFSFELYLHFAL